MDRLHPAACGEVGECPRDAQHPVIAARGEAELLDRLGEDAPPFRIGCGDLFQQFAIGFRIGADAVRCVARILPGPRLGDTGGTGVGLGLAVAHGFVTAMGGTITPLPTPGGGLTMRIALPLADAEDSAS